MALRTSPLSSIETSALLGRLHPADDGEFGCDVRQWASLFNWLEQAMEQAETAQTRRLIADVLGDVRALGPIDGDLVDLVFGALASVDVVMELERAGRLR